MPSALIALFVTTLVVVSIRAEPPLNIGLGDLAINSASDGGYSSSLDASYGAPSSGLLNGGYSDSSSSLGGYDDSVGSKGGEIIAKSAAKGVRYAGPIVYTNEKPPVIHFPRPPKPKKGGYGKKGIKAQSIKYVPMPHHDLPILIYQSDINPPIHVVNPPKGQSFSQSSYGVPSKASSSFGSSSSSYSSVSYNSPQAEYGTSSSSYGVPAVTNSYGSPAISSQSYGAPAISSQSYGAPAISSHSYVSSSSYGPPKSSKGYRQLKGDFGGFSNSESYGPPKKAAPLPHIIYAGHPPIHIFQQPPIYMSAPTKSSYGPPPSKSKKAQSFSYGSSKGSSYTEYGPPSKGSTVTYTEYGAPSKGSSFSSYSKGYYKGDHGSSSKGHKGDKGFGHFGSALSNHFGFGKSSFSFSLPKFNYGHGKSQGSSGGYHQKTKYVVAPKAWNKPPIIIYQGVRPPVTVYETPATGGYSDAGSSGGYSSSSVVNPVEVAPVTHTVNPIALSPPVTVLEGNHDPHAHVAGTDSPGNPSAHGVDLTYGQLSRISPDVGQLLDPRHKTHYTTATARSIWIPSYGLPSQYQARQLQQQEQPAALYVSDLTSSGQNYQIVRRSDLLDQSILYGISELRSQQDKTVKPTSTSVEPTTAQLLSHHKQPIAQSRIDILPNFLSTANENTLSSIPVSYSSVIVPSAGSGSVGPSSSPISESMDQSGSKSS